MKIRLLLVPVFAALLVAGCGKKEETASTSATTGATPAASAPTPPASAASATPAKSAARVVEVTANDAMKFSVTTIDAKAGEEITIKLVNVGTLPKQAMGHNLVVLKAGSDANAFSMAAMTAAATEYVPDSLKNQVVAHTKLLGPKESDSITFKVPAAGEYPFICTFPAHAMAGMKGTIMAK